jgi:hypothetical protein
MFNEERKWKWWLWSFVVTVSILLAGIAAFQIVVDPFFVWQVTTRSGVNNLRTAQANFDRVVKPYQFVDANPKVVIVGDSRVKLGIPPVWPGYEPESVYNFGIDSARISEVELVVDFLLAHNPPELVVLGVDLISFQRPDGAKEDSISERINTINKTPFSGFFQKVGETCFSYDAILNSRDTLLKSRNNPQRKPKFKRGWMIRAKKFKRPDSSRYLRLLAGFNEGYPTLEVVDGNFESLVRIIRKLKSADISIEVFAIPISADFQHSIYINKRWKILEKIKRTVASETPFWDFAYINSITLNRNAYIDASHFGPKAGQIIGDTIGTGARDQSAPDFGVRVKPNNIERHLAEVRRGIENYVDENTDMAKVIRDYLKHRDKARFNREVMKFID